MTSVSGTGGPFSSTKPSRVPKNPRRPRRPSQTLPRPPRCARSSPRCPEEHLDDSPAPFGTVQPRARKPCREHPEGSSRPTPEPDRPEAPRQLDGSGTAPRRALRRKNRRASCDAWKGRFEPPSPGFPPLRRLLNECSHLHRNCLFRLRCAFRFSQPLDAFIRPRPFGLVSCRFRPWGSCSQRFPPPSSRHDFRRALSPGRASPLARRRSGPRDSCTWEVRSHRGGFTRIRWPMPLSALCPFEEVTLEP